jgi:uncharacterized protein (DUF488 family)
MTQPFFTIGHSTHTAEEFIALLTASEVGLVVDVRTVPRSRTNPQYNRDTLPATLEKSGLAYEHVAALGGLRGKSRLAPPDVNAFWENDSFHNYADYALTEPFRAAVAALRETGHARRSAIMCAEAVWWRCHRRIITDYLLAAGETVFHIMGKRHVEPARMTPGAKPGPNGMLVYPAES